MARRGENIYKRRDGRWEGRYRIGVKPDGRVKYRSIYGCSYRDVKEKLVQLKSQSVAETVSSGKLTVKALFDEWMRAVQLRVKPSTYANYRMKLDKHILPEFGGYCYEQVSTEMIHHFIQKKLNSGLSAKYVSDIVVVFKSMAKYMSHLHGYRNHLENVTLPKSEKRDLKLLSSHEQKRLVSYLTGHMNPSALCILLSLYTGLRVGEVCGLQWGDIDFTESILTVRRTVQRIYSKHGTSLHNGCPKSRSSRRSIPIPAFLMLMLSQFRCGDNCYLLSGSENVIEPRTLQRRFKAILKKAELPSVNYHCLRHMFATNCIQLGFDIKTLAELLGHSSPETTLNRYLHSSMERKIACMKLLEPAA